MDDVNALRAWHFKQLRWSLQGLAGAGSSQRQLFPEFALAADELAFDFDHWLAVVRANYDEALTAAQLEPLLAIQRKLATMSRDGADFDLDLWTEAALATSEHWIEVRRLAMAALEAFEWPLDESPREMPQ